MQLLLQRYNMASLHISASCVREYHTSAFRREDDIRALNSSEIIPEESCHSTFARTSSADGMAKIPLDLAGTFVFCFTRLNKL